MPENELELASGSHVAEWHFVVSVVNEQTVLTGGKGKKKGEDWSRFSFSVMEQKQRGSLHLRCSRSHH